MFDTLFGPLSKDYCVWFLFLSILGYVLFVIAVITFLYLALTKQRSNAFFLQMGSVCLGYFVFYFQNRLLHSMCMNKMEGFSEGMKKTMNGKK